MSSYVRVASFFQLYTFSGSRKVIKEKYNNCAPGVTVSYGGVSYPYLSFIYQGAAKNRTGDNLEAQILLSVNQISTGLAKEAVDGKYMVKMYSALMNDNDTVKKVLTEDTWVAATMSYDNENVEVLLSSAIDAVGANAPTRVLTRKIVGDLPITASIRSQ